MAAAASLSTRDVDVLEKIKDPDYNPQTNVLLDSSLPRDPHISDTSVYQRVIQKEREIVLAMQQLELQLAGLRPQTVSEPQQEYRGLLAKLGDFIAEYPNYASARNNRVQAVRRLYGDTMLLQDAGEDAQRLIRNSDAGERQKMAEMALDDLDTAVKLLSPRMAFAAVSPQAAKTLSSTYTQRAAIYHTTGKRIGDGKAAVSGARREADWGRGEFEEAASRDFALGGRHGNEIAKGLAVSTNPTAKLCGQMVREAMKKEYGPEYGN
ncbi:hypothetical protein F5X68DRAFT_35287 [Plectosphaerella plurivora]|uniref:Uncharacterized protein n=1 Tax=Plectosphaerella plurivora TaxID=936078 RepID=A0A9P8V6B1_9PEZI|nr:hypothetical protein F5X68DRAFT_35287 [Plectosphaerella plurivora]